MYYAGNQRHYCVQLHALYVCGSLLVSCRGTWCVNLPILCTIRPLRIELFCKPFHGDTSLKFPNREPAEAEFKDIELVFHIPSSCRADAKTT